MKAARLKLMACSNLTPALPYALAPEFGLLAFVHNMSHRVHEAYQFAIANHEELAKYPCYCGCGAMGHESNPNCYLRVADTHAVGCGICVDITHDGMRLLREGKASPEIGAYVDAQYSSFGPSTKTLLPLT